MEVKLNIGDRSQSVEVRDDLIMDVLLPNEVPKQELTESELVERALREPIGTRHLRELVGGGKKIAIVTSDITRPMPSWKVMPLLLDELYAGGARPEDIRLIFALGSHRGHTEEEMRHLVGDRAYEEIECLDLDTSDCVHFGYTRSGTPVDIDRRVAEADIRICLGNVEYHYFAGYSGGAKAIMPGVSTRAAIESNHSHMVEPDARVGKLEGNPIREDLEEACAMVGVDFILNVVLSPKKEILYAAAGDVTEAHRAACRYLDSLYLKEIPGRADIVMVSQGGSPKDMNLYQTQKALDNAKHAVRDGGVIILVGSCREGFGEGTFEQWMREAEKPQDIVDRLKRGFRLGGHKAAAIALVLERCDIYLVSDLEPELVRSIFMEPFATVAEAYEKAKEKCGEDARVLVMPYGGSTLPKID